MQMTSIGLQEKAKSTIHYLRFKCLWEPRWNSLTFINFPLSVNSLVANLHFEPAWHGIQFLKKIIGLDTLGNNSNSYRLQFWAIPEAALFFQEVR